MASSTTQSKTILREKGQKASFPDWTKPMKATLTDERFSDPDWLYEPKLDGERLLCYKRGRDVTIYSRNHNELNVQYPEVVDALRGIEHDVVLDGEIVAFDGNITSFSKLQRRMHVKNEADAKRSLVDVFYYCFDLLYLDGYDVSVAALGERKKLLRSLDVFDDTVRFTKHVTEDGETYWRDACAKGWEGVIAKDATSPYTSSRSKKWLKFKCVNEQELVIVGYTEPQGARTSFGALLVGYYDGDKLRYAGKVGTGFDDATLRELKQRFDELETKHAPVTDEATEKDVQWLKPDLVAQIGFTEWTNDNKLRHPRFVGLRRDKNPRDVVKESPS